jgi:hypothetical protein
MKYFLIFFVTFSYSQFKPVYYNHGYEGIEIVAKYKDSTLIYSNKAAKATIRKEVGDSIVKKYKSLKEGKLTVRISNAEIIGTIKIERKPRLIHVTFSYEKVKWDSGLQEEYKLKPKIKMATHKRAAHSRTITTRTGTTNSRKTVRVSRTTVKRK